ncbi:hypothetical protein ABPG72_019117 [Tetrahymena utriculariae]
MFVSMIHFDEMDSDENILIFETYLKEFNSIAKLIDYSTREKIFLENFSKLVKFVDKQNKKVFQHFGVEADICIHKLVRDKYFSKQRMLIYLTTIKEICNLELSCFHTRIRENQQIAQKILTTQRTTRDSMKSKYR